MMNEFVTEKALFGMVAERARDKTIPHWSAKKIDHHLLSIERIFTLHTGPANPAAANRFPGASTADKRRPIICDSAKLRRVF